ncbi:MAG: GNAT family N-acetyltransferase [Pseudomonadota bacterium]|nr:GNAT family N-acetyltransferase [Pseudomonadota bacterium]
MTTVTDTRLDFRDATVDDIPGLVVLVTSAYRGESSRAGWTTEADLLDGNRIDPEVLRGDIQRPASRVLLAERDGRLLGCAHIAIEDGAGYFGMFAVDPQRQAAGLGKAILAEAERAVRHDWSLPMMRMTVIDLREDLIAWYERRGYRRTGTKKPFPAVDPRFGLPRRDDLRFEVLEKAL